MQVVVLDWRKVASHTNQRTLCRQIVSIPYEQEDRVGLGDITSVIGQLRGK